MILFSTRSNDSQCLSLKGPIFYRYKDIHYSKLCYLVAKLCLTLCNPMDCSLPGSSDLGILQAKLLEWVAIPFSKGCSQPRNQTWIFCVFCTGKRILYHWSTRTLYLFCVWYNILFKLIIVFHLMSLRNVFFNFCLKKTSFDSEVITEKKKRKKQKKTFAGLLNSIQSHDSMLYRKSKRQRGGGDQKKIFLSWFWKGRWLS